MRFYRKKRSFWEWLRRFLFGAGSRCEAVELRWGPVVERCVDADMASVHGRPRIFVKDLMNAESWW